MSQSEDYLDSLLNSISAHKSEGDSLTDSGASPVAKNNSKRLDPEEDFLVATGISSDSNHKKKNSYSNLKSAFSENDFLKELDLDMDSSEADDFIAAFEKELDLGEDDFLKESQDSSKSTDFVDDLFNNISNIVDDEESDSFDSLIHKEDDDALADFKPDGFDLDLSTGLAEKTLELGEKPLDEDDVSAVATDTVQGSTTDLLGPSNVEEALPLDLSAKTKEVAEDPMAEFAPDEMDAIDAKEFPLQGDDAELDLDLSDLLLQDDEDLSDINSLLDGVEEPSGIDDSVESDLDVSYDQGDADKKGKKRRKKKEKGEKKPNPFLQNIYHIVFGEDDPEEAEEAKKTSEAKLDADGNPIEDSGKTKKKVKKEKPKKEKPKKQAKPKKVKPKKTPKPKKVKKPKEPDNSPKIPLSIIATFLILSASIIVVVLLGMNYMGVQRHMSQARDLFNSQDYIAAYEKLNGLDLNDESDILVRNQARTLADLQQCQDEYETFYNNGIYDFALDSLLKGLGRYEKFKDDASEYGIADEYDAYGQQIIDELSSSYNLSYDEAMNIYNQKNRHYYTVELRKVLIKLGLEDDSNT